MSDTVTTLVLLMLVALRVLVICIAAWLFIPKRRACPHCASATMALVSPRWMTRLRVHRRWCMCGWAGWSKLLEWTPPGDGGPAGTPPLRSPGHGRTRSISRPAPPPRVPGDHA